MEAVVAKKLVVVALVEVDCRAVKFCKVEEPLERRLATVAKPVAVMLPTEEIAVAKKLVELAVVEKKLVVVAELPVALTKVKFCRVELPESSRFESEVKPAVAVKVPVKLAAELIVWELIKPEVMAPVDREPVEVMLPVFKEVAKRLVEEAVVEKKLVLVALVVVALPDTLRSPMISRAQEGELFLMPTRPLLLMVKAATVEVAKVLGEAVAM